MASVGGLVAAHPAPTAKFAVIGAGVSRTGTKSFGEALSIVLGGPVHDAGVQAIVGPQEVAQRWLEVLELASIPPSSRSDTQQYKMQWLLSALTEGYVGTVDWPANFLTEELLQLYPEAIVICTTRDFDGWARSMAVLGQMMNNWYFPILMSVVPKLSLHKRQRELWDKMVEIRYHVSSRAGENFTIATHENYLRKKIPKEKLHFYNVQSGWGPLCEILGVEVPSCPFPYRNKGDEIQRTFRKYMCIGGAIWTGILGSALVAGWFLVRNSRLKLLKAFT
ncbi:hypothetical protein AC578_6803 [Pseudocercospora eumusae]|uniref:Uncharacterized protein n=1 Tax=Pseudocercospora eumusae TaxID=321146 RepID=A0A139GUS1_9PEZI|nr:hypothetical protein AC578_6803 [Pseudocercospora eumusae]